MASWEEEEEEGSLHPCKSTKERGEEYLLCLNPLPRSLLMAKAASFSWSVFGQITQLIHPVSLQLAGKIRSWVLVLFNFSGIIYRVYFNIFLGILINSLDTELASIPMSSS